MESDNNSTNSWKITVVSPTLFVPALEEIFYAQNTETFPSIATFEIKGNDSHRLVEIYTNEDPDPLKITKDIKTMAEVFQIEPPEIEIQKLDDIDWVSESQKILKPIEAGKFFLYGKHDEEKIPDGTIPILMEAGQAFGTGSHETTNGCLLAIDELRSETNPSRILDLGCGSGVLAIAMAKQWDAEIIASDIDPVATETASSNLRVNNVNEGKNGVTLVTCSGFEDDALSTRAPYDLVVANILAEPLITLSADITHHLTMRGLVVLSGLLKDQEKQVLKAYTEKGMDVVGTIPINEWQTLILKKREI